MVDHPTRQRRLEGLLVVRRPLGLLGLHGLVVLEQLREGYRSGCDGDIEGGLSGEVEEGAELAGKGVGDFFEGGVDLEEGAVRRVLDVVREDDGRHEFADLFAVAGLELPEVLSCILEGSKEAVALVVWEAVDGRALQQPYELQAVQLEFQVRRIRL